jgi:hypothetical protein
VTWRRVLTVLVVPVILGVSACGDDGTSAPAPMEVEFWGELVGDAYQVVMNNRNATRCDYSLYLRVSGGEAGDAVTWTEAENTWLNSSGTVLGSSSDTAAELTQAAGQSQATTGETVEFPLYTWATINQFVYRTVLHYRLPDGSEQTGTFQFDCDLD